MDEEKENTNAVEIWGGAEYSYIRTGDSVYDQLAQSGHEERPEDLNLFSTLGIKTIRYPLLWEKHENDGDAFFRLHDNRLEILGRMDIEPIAGLLHHGSGPFYTDLLDPDFPYLLAEYAYRIAARYPWIEYYTPVNEPLTTARFSGLYGIWYPHRSGDKYFLRIFLNELKGIILAMKAVRSINPQAKLVQTEDLCKVYSTDQLKYQADFENLRRWLTYDILLGKLGPGHPLWKFFTDAGISEQELDFFRENKIVPSVCGFNYYVTSERYLDHHKSLYPSYYHGANRFHEYADVEAARANIPVTIGSGKLLKEAWDRYHLPVALTEVHISCTREEQLRWFYEAYQSANELKKLGIDIRAVTAWSFFGSFDWNSLLVRKNNDYESGIYDIRSGNPRATALAGMIKSLNEGSTYHRSLIEVPGWWRRTNRFIFKDEREPFLIEKDINEKYSQVAPLLIIGATGSLGSAFARVCESRGIICYLSERSQLDIASEESARNFLDLKKPWAVINAAGFSKIDEAENDFYTCFRENTTGPGILAGICKSEGIKFVTFSTDQVFNGIKRQPYHENDSTEPLNLYGLSKRIAEEKVMKINPDSLVIRSSFFFNPWHINDSLAKILLSGSSSDKHYYLASDIIVSPSYIPDIVNTVLDLMIDGESGIWHLSNQEEISYSDFSRMALKIAGFDESIVYPVPSARLRYAALRPSYSVLRSSCMLTMPSLSNALERYINEFCSKLQITDQISL